MVTLDTPIYVPSLPTADAAALLGVAESRFRSGWRQSGIVHPVATGYIRREDIVRAAVLVSLQAIFGEQTPLAVEMAKALTTDELLHILEADEPAVTVFLPRPARRFYVALDPRYIAGIRRGLVLPRF